MVKRKKEKKNLFSRTFEVKKIIKPAPVLTPAQRRELVKEIVTETEIKPIRVEPAIEPIEEIFEEPMKKLPPLRIKSDLLKDEESSILTRNKNIFFKE